MKRNARLVLFTVVATLLSTAQGTVLAQVPSEPNMVFVHVNAIERNGRVVTGLAKEQFQILEDNVRQEIAFFSNNDIPISVSVLLDVEGSTTGQMKGMALSGLTGRNSPRDEFLVTESGRSPLNEAVYQTLSKLLQRGNDSKRALVLLTTRTDPAAYSFSKVKELLREHDVRFYVIGIPLRPDVFVDRAKPVLRELAEVSGGTAFFPPSIIQVEDVCRSIGRELRNQYLMGYRSTNGATDGKWRKIKINAELVDRGKIYRLATRSKTGYYAPASGSLLPPKS